jgi:hypothetical protein
MRRSREFRRVRRAHDLLEGETLLCDAASDTCNEEKKDRSNASVHIAAPYQVRLPVVS